MVNGWEGHSREGVANGWEGHGREGVVNGWEGHGREGVVNGWNDTAGKVRPTCGRGIQY